MFSMSPASNSATVIPDHDGLENADADANENENSDKHIANHISHGEHASDLAPSPTETAANSNSNAISPTQMQIPQQIATPIASPPTKPRHRMPPFTQRRSDNTVKSNQPTLTPLVKLEKLIRSIEAVYKGYSTSTSASPIYLAALSLFLQRATDLLPPDLAYAHPDTYELRRSSPASHSHPKYESTYFHAPLAGKLQLRLSHQINQSPQQQSTAQDHSGPSLEAVEELEYEWLASEVVAAWYGPRPKLSPISISPSAQLGSPVRRPAPPLHPQRTKSDLHYSKAVEEHADRPGGKTPSKSAVHARRRYQPEPIIRKDPSYVGLNDE